MGREGLLDSYVISFQISEQLKSFAKLLWCLDHQDIAVSEDISRAKCCCTIFSSQYVVDYHS